MASFLSGTAFARCQSAPANVRALFENAANAAISGERKMATNTGTTTGATKQELASTEPRKLVFRFMEVASNSVRYKGLVPNADPSDPLAGTGKTVDTQYIPKELLREWGHKGAPRGFVVTYQPIDGYVGADEVEEATAAKELRAAKQAAKKGSVAV